jgi:hypothetical protein
MIFPNNKSARGRSIRRRRTILRGFEVEAGKEIREEVEGVGFVGWPNDPLGRSILYPGFLRVDPAAYWVGLIILVSGLLDRPTKTYPEAHETCEPNSWTFQRNKNVAPATPFLTA